MLDALAQPREVSEDLVQGVGAAVRRRRSEHPEPQVLQHREIRQHPPLLRNPCDAAPGDLVGLEHRDVLAAQAHVTPLGPRDAHDRAERRCLAGAVAPDERDHLALTDRQRHALEDVGLAIVGVDVLDGEQVHRPAPR